MVNVLDRLGLTRDSVIWIVGILLGVVGCLGAHYDLLRLAFPSINPAWQARIELASVLLSVVSAKLSFSPLAQSGELGIHANPTRTLTTFTGNPKA